MRNIWTVFKTDVKTLSKCFFACAVVVAIAVLPSLYAWLNIYSNWDPYGNTGGISIALVSLDKGYTDEDGVFTNKGQDVVDDLREATSIDWVIVDSEKQAKDGVYAGDYYAAVVIDKDFTYKMYHMLTEWTGKPSITYYENAKKNAVATKITDTAVESLKRTISENYLEVVIGRVMTQANLLAADLTEDDPEAAVKGLFYQVQDLLAGCRATMDAFDAAKNSNTIDIDSGKLSQIIQNINSSLPDTGKIQETVAQIDRAIYTALEKVQRALDQFQQAIADGGSLDDARKAIEAAADTMGQMGDKLTEWADRLEQESAGNAAAKLARSIADKCYQLQDRLTALTDSDDLETVINDCKDIAAAVGDLTGKLLPTADELRKELENVMGQISNAMENVKGLGDDVRAVQNALANTALALDETMALLRPAAERLSQSVSETLDKLQNLTADEYMDILLDILNGDPETYGQYFSQMVQTTVTPIYPIENYGSAMAPFYTVLAIWVGGVILVAIIKSHARLDGLIDPKPRELYFGRYIIFFLLSQIQAAVIITGDLFLLKIQCLHPGLLYLTGALTALTFSLLIYSLALSFGDVGKAIVVVVMVLQIAGSSGTFPIELLPEIYQKIYRFFPFPYAIDAMRECICGLYGDYYITQLLFLLLFCAAALVIGLLVRRPFMGLNHFMEAKLEETELF